MPPPRTALELVGLTLLDGRQLGHRRGDDVAQRPTPRRSRREAPRGTLVVHQAACAVDGVDDDGPRRVVPDDDRLLQSLRHELDVGPVLLEPTDQRVVGHAVDRVDRVGRGLSLDHRHIHAARGHDRSRTWSPSSQRSRRASQESAARSSAAFSSGSDSLVIDPPPISGPARYFSRPGARSGGWNSTWNG